MVIDRITACIFYDRNRIATIAVGSQQSQPDHDDRSRFERGYSEIVLQLFFISQLFLVRFSYSFQQNDGNILLSTALMSYKAQICFFFSTW